MAKEKEGNGNVAQLTFTPEQLKELIAAAVAQGVIAKGSRPAGNPEARRNVPGSAIEFAISKEGDDVFEKYFTSMTEVNDFLADEAEAGKYYIDEVKSVVVK